jgi:hypothetical protein
MELNASPKPIEGLKARKLDIHEEALRKRIEVIAGPTPEPPPPPEPDVALTPYLGGE